MMNSLNNHNALNSSANVFDSVIPAAHFVCNSNLPCLDVGNRFSRPQTSLNSPESRTLEFESILGIGSNFFFHYRSMSR